MRCWGEQFPREDTPWRQLWRYFYHPNYLHLSPNVKRFSSHSKSSKGAPLKALLLPPKKNCKLWMWRMWYFPLHAKDLKKNDEKCLRKFLPKKVQVFVGIFTGCGRIHCYIFPKERIHPQRIFRYCEKKLCPSRPFFQFFQAKEEEWHKLWMTKKCSIVW